MSYLTGRIWPAVSSAPRPKRCRFRCWRWARCFPCPLRVDHGGGKWGWWLWNIYRWAAGVPHRQQDPGHLPGFLMEPGGTRALRPDLQRQREKLCETLRCETWDIQQMKQFGWKAERWELEPSQLSFKAWALSRAKTHGQFRNCPGNLDLVRGAVGRPSSGEEEGHWGCGL